VEVLGDAEKVGVYNGAEGLIFEAYRKGVAR
jgi:hypothetical protein